MKHYITPAIIIIAAIAISSAIIFSQAATSATLTGSINRPAIIDSSDAQHILISAKRGFTPHTSIASPDKKTILSIKTDATYDCSSTVVIPALRIARNLPPSGTTTIEIPPQPAGTVLKGLCSMGMYEFEIKFQS